MEARLARIEAAMTRNGELMTRNGELIDEIARRMDALLIDADAVQEVGHLRECLRVIDDAARLALCED